MGWKIRGKKNEERGGTLIESEDPLRSPLPRPIYKARNMFLPEISGDWRLEKFVGELVFSSSFRTLSSPHWVTHLHSIRTLRGRIIMLLELDFSS